MEMDIDVQSCVKDFDDLSQEFKNLTVGFCGSKQLQETEEMYKWILFFLHIGIAQAIRTEVGWSCQPAGKMRQGTEPSALSNWSYQKVNKKVR